MNGRRILVDSNILIYFSKGLLRIVDVLNDHDRLYISVITYMEVLGFPFEKAEEKVLMKQLLDYFEVVYINSEIAELVISFKQKKKIKLPDAIILATAKWTHCDLLTRNIKDFKNITKGVKLIDPFKTRKNYLKSLPTSQAVAN